MSIVPDKMENWNKFILTKREGLVPTFVELIQKYDTNLMARAFYLKEGQVLHYMLTPVAPCSDVNIQRGRDGIRAQLKLGHRHFEESDLYMRLQRRRILEGDHFDDGQLAIFFTTIADRRYHHQILEEPEVSRR